MFVVFEGLAANKPRVTALNRLLLNDNEIFSSFFLTNDNLFLKGTFFLNFVVFYRTT